MPFLLLTVLVDQYDDQDGHDAVDRDGHCDKASLCLLLVLVLRQLAAGNLVLRVQQVLNFRLVLFWVLGASDELRWLR